MKRDESELQKKQRQCDGLIRPPLSEESAKRLKIRFESMIRNGAQGGI
jgi:hypothetical protein